MTNIFRKIPRRGIAQALPRASLGIAPMLLSVELGLSVMAGYFAARFFAGAKTGDRGRLPSLVFDIKEYRVHLHHWFVFLIILVATAVANFFLAEPAVFYGFLGGVVAQGVLHYEDWPRIVTKQKKHSC